MASGADDATAEGRCTCSSARGSMAATQSSELPAKDSLTDLYGSDVVVAHGAADVDDLAGGAVAGLLCPVCCVPACSCLGRVAEGWVLLVMAALCGVAHVRGRRVNPAKPCPSRGAAEAWHSPGSQLEAIGGAATLLAAFSKPGPLKWD